MPEQKQAIVEKGTKATSFKDLTPKQKKDLAIIGGVAALISIWAATKKSATTTTTATTGVTGVATSAPATGQQALGITPGVPVSLTQTGATNSSITLTWTPVQNAVNYLLYDYTTNLLIGQSSTNTITVNNLQANTHYTWYVEAQSTTGQASGASEPVTVATSSNTQVATVPNVPQALTVTNTTSTSVTFSWSSVTGATYYQITTLPAGQSTGGQVLSPISGTTATVSGLSPNTQYQFSLQACNSAGCSNPSGLTMATTTTGTQLSSITISPSSGTVQVNQTQQFTATGTNSDGTTSDVTSQVTWSSNSQSTATISASGLATGVAVGATTISACIGSVCGYAVIAVQPSTGAQQGVQSPTNLSAGLSSISVSPATTSVTVGATQQLTATAQYADGNQQDVTSQVTWSSSDSRKARINARGLLTGVSQGSATISACINSICGSANATVQPTQAQQAQQQAQQTAQQTAQQQAAQQQAQLTAAQQAQQLLQLEETAARYGSNQQAQQVFSNQAQQHNTYAQQNNYGTLVTTQNTPLVNTLQSSGASLQTTSQYYNANNNTYNYLTTNNAGGYSNGKYVPVTTGVTGVSKGQSTTLMGSQCMAGTLNGKSGSWDGYGSFHAGCSDCKCAVGG